MTARNTILFLCVANSARSQMAEAWARSLAPDGVCILSAGSNPDRVHPHAIEAMREVGLDLSDHRSTSVHDIDTETICCAVTLCANEVCPPLATSVRHLHWPHADPATDGANLLEAFRRVRDQLGTRIRTAFSQGEFSEAATG